MIIDEIFNRFLTLFDRRSPWLVGFSPSYSLLTTYYILNYMPG